MLRGAGTCSPLIPFSPSSPSSPCSHRESQSNVVRTGPSVQTSRRPAAERHSPGSRAGRARPATHAAVRAIQAARSHTDRTGSEPRDRVRAGFYLLSSESGAALDAWRSAGSGSAALALQRQNGSEQAAWRGSVPAGLAGMFGFQNVSGPNSFWLETVYQPEATNYVKKNFYSVMIKFI